MKPAEALPYDILIVGAGIVGACLALALGRSARFRIAVVETKQPLSEKISQNENEYDLRVSAITRASENIFKNLGVWESIEAQRLSPFREMHVWDAMGAGEIHFDSAEIGEPHLGYIIENQVIQNALLEQYRQLDTIELYAPVQPRGLVRDDHGFRLQLEDGRCLKTRLLVGADGANSQIRQWAGINSYGWDYHQKGLVTTVQTEKPHQETAWQRFLPQGPIAFLPLDDPHRCSIVWSTTSTHAAKLLSMEAHDFALALATAFEYRLGAIQAIGPRAAFPLRLQHAQAYIQPQLALVGDAAHTIHPLAGQGVNLGLLDTATLADVLVTAHIRKRNPGSLTTLRRFERWRKGDNLIMQLIMDGFKHLFGSRRLPILIARNFGLTLTEANRPVKRLIMRRASGLTGDLPPLAKPAPILD